MTRTETRKIAQTLRDAGKSYGAISRELGVAKSTLSYWFSATSEYLGTSEKQKEHLKKIRFFAIESKQKKIQKRKQVLKEKVSKQFCEQGEVDLFTKKIALSMLYWAEGTKSKKGGGVSFANTDPMLIKTFVLLLKDCFSINISKIKLRLAIHGYHDEQECKKFWSNLVGVGINQFHKTYIKPRSVTKKFRENFMGICFVYYPNSDIRKEILEIGGQFCDGVQKLSSFNG